MSGRNDPAAKRKAALAYVIKLAKEERRRFAVSASGAKYGFEFGIKAKAHVEEIDGYIAELERMKSEGPLL